MISWRKGTFSTLPLYYLTLKIATACFSLCILATWTTDFLQVKWIVALLKKASGNQPCILLNQHADHLLGLSQMAIWKAFSHYVLMWYNCPLFSMTHLSFFYAKELNYLGFFSCYLLEKSDMTLMSVFFLTRKEHMLYFEKWLNLTAWELTLRICNFLTLPHGTHVCLLFRPENIKLST